MHKTYQSTSRLSARVVVDRVEKLLAHEGVKYQTTDFSIASTRTPIVLLGFQPSNYTRKNWVGINPFTVISGLEINCEETENALTVITVRINRRRTLLIFAYWPACALLAARGMPEPAAGAIVFTVVTIAAWFVVVPFLGGYLVKKELEGALIE